MAEILLFHHVCGLTPGVLAFADTLRSAGHTVHTPDVFGGRTFDSVADGMAFIEGGGLEGSGFEGMIDTAASAADGLPDALVYAGFSFGVMAAQKLAQTRPGAVGALFFESCAPPSFFGVWPDDVPVQIHGMESDPIFAGEGDVDAAREVVAAAADGELFLYPGDKHLFADPSLDSYDADATQLLTSRTLDFLAAR